MAEEPCVWEIRLHVSVEGPGNNRRYGCNIVAPPGNQAANRENKPQPAARKAPVYSTKGMAEDRVRYGSRR